LETDEQEVVVGIVPPVTKRIIRLLEKYHNKTIRVKEIPQQEFLSWLRKQTASAGLEGESFVSPDGNQSDSFGVSEAPVVALINDLIQGAISENASDIHFEEFTDGATVRYRVDGVLRTIDVLPKERCSAIASRIKIMANLNILEKRQPQDGRFTFRYNEADHDVRVSIVPIAKGESIVLRLLRGVSDKVLAINEIGFLESQVTMIHNALQHPHGLVLATGPTGSGKSTSLISLLNEVRDESRKLLTIEDPIEHIVDGVAQIQTNETIGLTFDSILRRILRQDPNIILVGEVRDITTAELVMRTALTGHLVLSTLHTNDAIGVIPRLRNIGIESYMIPSVLRLAFAQRLVRRLCPHCRESTVPQGAIIGLFDRYQINLPHEVYEAKGCAVCGNTGYTGRIAVGEVFSMNEELEDAIVKHARASELAAIAIRAGMITMKNAALIQVANGITTLSEIAREISI
jgi:type II secretory ATPase GspE/PulE/Tfp pilus assembly ATPase PilB-like protein